VDEPARRDPARAHECRAHPGAPRGARRRGGPGRLDDCQQDVAVWSDLYQNSIKFDGSSNTLSFNVKNWPNCGLGAYVQFLDTNDNPISNPVGWQDRLSFAPGFIRNWLEPNNSKWYL
jgi:hypothetical protein